MIDKENNMIICDCCGKSYDDPKHFVIGIPQKDVNICVNCFNETRRMVMNYVSGLTDKEKELMKEIGLEDEKDIEKEIKANKTKINEDMMKNMYKIAKENTPVALKEYLDEYVIGQEGAKKTLAIAVYNHYKKAMFDMGVKSGQIDVTKVGAPDELSKSSILLIGPSGTGKTFLLRNLAKKLNIPLAVCDASCLTESGFVGSDPETCIRDLYKAANGDISKAEYGIVFLDEFDKLARKSGENNSITADPGREGVQQALLKIIEGGHVSFTENGRKHPDAATIEMDTSNILFVCGGAFDGIEKIIEARVSSNSMGFNTTEEDDEHIDLSNMEEGEKYNTLIDKVNVEDFKKFGIISEILGRLPIVCKLHQLTEEEMYDILTKPKNALVKQYKTLNNIIDNIHVNFDDDALKAIAHDVIKKKIGARGLITVIENHLGDAMYEASKLSKVRKPNEFISITVSKDCIENNVAPEIKVNTNGTDSTSIAV